jgi:putative SOS response-associated peptidase YedK
MCGRFTATFEFSDIRVRWNLHRDLAKYKPRFNIAPEQISPTIPVIVRQGRQREQAHALGVNSALGRRPKYRKPYDINTVPSP